MTRKGEPLRTADPMNEHGLKADLDAVALKARQEPRWSLLKPILMYWVQCIRTPLGALPPVRRHGWLLP